MQGGRHILQSYSKTTMQDSREHALELEILAGITVPEIYQEVCRVIPIESWSNSELLTQLGTSLENKFPLPPIDSTPSEDPVADAAKLKVLKQQRPVIEIQDELRNLMTAGASPLDFAKFLEDGAARMRRLIKIDPVKIAFNGDDLAPVIEKKHALLHARKSSGDYIGVATGFPQLDHTLEGLQTGIHLLAAEPGAGKTALSLNIARNVAASGTPVVFISFEEDIEILFKRTYASPEMPLAPLINGSVKPIDLITVINKQWQNRKKLYFIQGSSKLMISDIKAAVANVVKSCSADRCLLIIDYLQKMANILDVGDRREFRFVVGKLSSELREWSTEISSPILSICSQNRNLEGKASMTSLKESGELEYNADTVMFLTTDNKEEEDMYVNKGFTAGRDVTLQIKKNRFGRLTKIQMVFDAGFAMFKEKEEPRRAYFNNG